MARRAVTPRPVLDERMAHAILLFSTILKLYDVYRAATKK